MTVPLKEWLDEQDGDDLNGSAGKKVLEALRAVVELHQRGCVDEQSGAWCEECNDTEGRSLDWPCPTIRAIEKEVLRG